MLIETKSSDMVLLLDIGNSNIVTEQDSQAPDYSIPVNDIRWWNWLRISSCSTSMLFNAQAWNLRHHFMRRTTRKDQSSEMRVGLMHPMWSIGSCCFHIVSASASMLHQARTIIPTDMKNY